MKSKFIIGFVFTLVSCSYRESKKYNLYSENYKDTILYKRNIMIPANATVSYRDSWYDIEFDGINIDLYNGAIGLEIIRNELSQITIQVDTTTEYKRVYYGHSTDGKKYYVIECELTPYTSIGKGLYGYNSMSCQMNDADLKAGKDRVVQQIFEAYLKRTINDPFY